MDQRIKDLLYMAVGLISTSQKAKVLLEKMQIEGRLTEEEGRRIVHEIFDNSREAANNFKDEVKHYIQDLLNELKTPTTKEFEALKQRVDELEKTVAQLKQVNEN